jgi:hypothetical protein
MKLSNPLLSIAASLPFAFGAARAQVIFTDTFDSGTGSWFRASNVNTLANNVSGQLAWSSSNGVGAPNDGVAQVIGRSMAAQTLAVGQTIRLTFDYTQTTTTVSPDIFRVGFYNVATPPTADGWSTTGTLVGAFTGYTTFVRDANASGNFARSESATDNNLVTTGPTMGVAGTFADITSPANTQNIDIVANTTYQAVFEVTLTSASQINTLFTLSNGFSVAGQTSTVYNGFDMVALRSINSALFDNIKVEVLPDLTTPIQVVITPNGADFDFSWNSKAGKLYDLLTSTDLATPVSSWPVHDPDGPGGNAPFGNIPSAGTTTTLTAVPSADPRRFFAIREQP